MMGQVLIYLAAIYLVVHPGKERPKGWIPASHQSPFLSPPDYSYLIGSTCPFSVQDGLRGAITAKTTPYEATPHLAGQLRANHPQILEGRVPFGYQAPQSATIASGGDPGSIILTLNSWLLPTKCVCRRLLWRTPNTPENA